jgi:4-carboxymuconolactone decarboxylase
MSEDGSHAARRRRALDVYRSLRGEPDGDFAPTLAGVEAFLGAIGSFSFDHALGDIWARPGLARRDRSLVSVTALTCLGSETELRTHLGGALNHGVSFEELEEVLLHVSGYAGMPRAFEAMRVALALFAERDDVDRSTPRPAPERKDDARRRADGSEVFERMTNGAVQRDAVAGVMLGEFGDALGRFGLDYLLGEIWARPQLSRRDRSLVTLTLLIALGRPTELRLHVPIALHHGLTRTEIEEVLLQLTLYAGYPAALDAAHVAREIFAARGAEQAR